jgi:hypothetical protein
MSDAKTYADVWNEDARLCMLKQLAAQHDGRLNEKMMQGVLDSFAYRMTRETVRDHMEILGALGAAKMESIKDDKGGDFLIATITREGVEHLERRAFIEGIAKPSLGV